MESPPGDITVLLAAWAEGDLEALGQVVKLAEDELRRLALHHLNREHGRDITRPTELLNEAFVRLIPDREKVHFSNRKLFYGGVKIAMTRVLIDQARHRLADKRGAGAATISLDDVVELTRGRPVELVRLDDALTDLRRRSPRQAHLVELRYLGGLSRDEICPLLSISKRAFDRDWRTAKLFLQRALAPSEDD